MHDTIARLQVAAQEHDVPAFLRKLPSKDRERLNLLLQHHVPVAHKLLPLAEPDGTRSFEARSIINALLFTTIENYSLREEIRDLRTQVDTLRWDPTGGQP